ncbi:MAG: trypsin-like peptidase domain-containing protein [Mycobacterium sp.]
MRFFAAGPAALTTGLLAAVTLSACGGGPHSSPPVQSAGALVTKTKPTAEPVSPDPRVGALFLGGTTIHVCTAGVLNTPSGNLIVTAAHCLAGGVEAAFVAGFNNQAAPQNVWHVDAVYLDPRWVANQDPMADFAVARVGRDGGGSVQTQAGGGFEIAPAPTSGTVVTVSGYGYGVGGGPVGCTAVTVRNTEGFPALACAGLVAGLSGAPWIVGSTVIGVVGGLDGGGCNDSLSYSPPFDKAITALLVRAEAGGPADNAPTVVEDTCDQTT